MNMNIVVLGGNLTRDPEMRYTPKGTAICNVGIANNRKWKAENGETMEEVSFFDLVAFGRTAETIEQYFRKGDPILVNGRLRQESWEDRESGKTRYAVKVIIDRFDFVGGKKDGQESTRGKTAGENLSAARKAAAGDDPPPEDDDVPF